MAALLSDPVIIAITGLLAVIALAMAAFIYRAFISSGHDRISADEKALMKEVSAKLKGREREGDESLLIQEICSLTGNLSYRPGEKIQEEELDFSLILPPRSEYKSRGIFEAENQNAFIRLSDIELWRKHGKKSVKTEATAILIQFQNKRLSGHTLMMPKGRRITGPARGKILKQVKLTSAWLARKFDVYTTEHALADFLLNAGLIAEMESLAEISRAGLYSAAAFGNNLVLLLENPRWAPGRVRRGSEIHALFLKRSMERIDAITEAYDA